MLTRSNTAELLQQALSLPPEDRLAIATELLNSVDSSEDEEWSDSWTKEIDRRADAVASGSETLESWESVETQILTDLRAK